MDNTTTVQYAGLISQLSDKARSVVRDLDPTNDLTFLRIRSRKHEIMVAPGKEKNHFTKREVWQCFLFETLLIYGNIAHRISFLIFSR
jgi:hypothetical protein